MATALTMVTLVGGVVPAVAAASAPPAATPRSAFYLEGEPGSWLLNGSTYSNDTVSFTGIRGTDILMFNAGWTVWVAPLPGESWAVGTYDAVDNPEYRRPGHAGLSLSGDGRGCSNFAGRLIVDDVALAPDGSPTRFSARFEAHCEFTYPPVFGQITYNSTEALARHSVTFTSSLPPEPIGRTSAPHPIAVSNPGPDPLHVGTATLTGADAASFAIADDGCGGQTLPSGGSCSIGVTFSPTGTVGTRAAQLQVFDDLTPVGGPGRAVQLTASAIRPDGEYTAVTPSRVLDTRDGNGQSGVPGALPAATDRTVQIAGRGGLPSTGVAAVVMNVTVTNPTSWGWLTVWPSGSAQPTVSNLNFVGGQTVANLVTVPVGPDGAVALRSANAGVDVLFDVVGYYASAAGPAGSRFHGITPVRFLDTRGPGTPIAPGGSLEMKFTGIGGVPSTGVTAIALNVTVVQPTSWGWVTTYPSDVPEPLASSVNFQAGQTVSNMVVVRVPANGVITFANELGSTHVVADVVGYYDQDRSTEAGRFVPVSPTRTFDSRQGFGALAPDDAVVITWLDQFQSPIGWLGAVVANLTVTEPTSEGWITAFPADASQIPWVSNLNFTPGKTVPSQVMTQASQQDFGYPRSSVAFYNPYGYTHVIVDLFGLFTNASAPAPAALAGTSSAAATSEPLIGVPEVRRGR